MGGLSALSYNVYGKHKAVGCAVSCPVCDLFAVEKTTPFFAASVYFACAHYTCDYEDAVKSLSPLYFVDHFPKNNYFFICCKNDTVIIPQENVIPLLKKMEEKGLNAKAIVLEDKDHCRHTPESINAFIDFIAGCYEV